MQVQQKIQAGFAVALAFLLLTGVAAWWSEQRNVETFRSVEHTYQVLDRFETMLVGMLNLETGYRGFAISGDEAFLQPQQAGIAAIQESLTAAKRLTQDNPDQQRRLAALEPLIQEKISRANTVVKLRRSGDTAGAFQFIATGQGKAVMDEIRKVIGEMEAAEEELLQQRTARAQAMARTTQEIVTFGGLLSLGLVGLASVIVRRDFEKRQRAEAERDRFFTLSLDMLCISHGDGYFKRVNSAFTHTLGWSAEEILAQPFLDFVHPDDWSATIREVERQVVAGEKVLHFENRYRHKDGSWRVLSWNSVPQPGGFMFATARDMTDIKLAEAALEEARQATAKERERLKFIFDAMPVGVSFTQVEADGRVVRRSNDAHLRICGLTREQVDEKGIFIQITHPEDRSIQAPFTRQIEEGMVDHYSMDKRYLRPDGQTVWVFLSFQRRWLADGGHEDLSVVVDITERKRLEEARHRSEQNLAVTLDSIGDAVLATDTEGLVTRLNPVAEKLVGWTQAEALGRPVAEVFRIVNEETRESSVIPVDQVLATGKIHGLANHTILIARDGKEQPIADSAAQSSKTSRPKEKEGTLLSPRQAEIARLVAHGLTDKEIGNELHLNEGTVGSHLKRIFLKWQLHSRAGLAARFIKETPPQPEPPIHPYHERGTSNNRRPAA